MKTLHILLCSAAVTLSAAATTTINPTNQYAWAGNFGWTLWHDAGADGAVIGQYVCSGYVWSPNCGWINLGDGTPDDGVHYSNASGSDYGVNLQDPYSSGGVSKAKLRGFAYAANIGWINFENQGNPELSLQTGRLSGYAWSANCGWINLDDANWFVATDVIQPGADSDNDGIADAFELTVTDPPSLTMLTATGDYDHDGKTDVEEYLADTNPLNPQSSLSVTEFVVSGTNCTLTWASSPARLYRITSSTDLLPASWELVLDHIVPDGASTSRSITVAAAAKRFFRVGVFLPLDP
ncbi:MAG: hypothetical protein NTV46_12855 [Verrucomicrobia bacterium]|nr:hypothetical protein [Verrucomicrobiota bacterium]